MYLFINKDLFASLAKIQIRLEQFEYICFVLFAQYTGVALKILKKS